jgi:predicted aspartyl protease
LVDTGFDGGVTVPPGLIDSSIKPDTQLPWLLADGSEIRTPAYLATVQIGRFQPITTVIIALGDEPLLGREVTDRFRVTFDHGQTILVEP